MKQTIFTNRNFFKINIDDYASQKEIKVIVESFKECVDIFYTTFNALRKDTKNKTSEFEIIFGNAESKTMSVVLNSLYEIKALLGSEIKFMRGSFFFDKKHQKHADVLASVNLDKKYVSIYNPFFEKDFRKEDNRGGVIFHELAHLVRLKDESELNNIKSAECLKNFALLVSGRVSVEDIVDDSSDNVDEAKQDDEELTYSPDQPRAPKGQPNGGQWIDKNGGDSAHSTSSKERGAQNKQEPLSEEETEFDFISYSKEDEEKAKHNTVLNLLDGGIKVRNNENYLDKEAGNWLSANIELKELKPNIPQTLIMEIKYSHTPDLNILSPSNTSITYPEKSNIKVAMDITPDDKGKVFIERAGILGEYLGVNSKFKEEAKMDIDIRIYVANGTVAENYGKPKQIKMEKNANKDLENKKKFGFGYYAVVHASEDYQIPQKKNYLGGSVKGCKDPKNMKIISIAKIKYDYGEQTIENCLNTAKGRFNDKNR